MGRETLQTSTIPGQVGEYNIIFRRKAGENSYVIKAGKNLTHSELEGNAVNQLILIVAAPEGVNRLPRV